MGKKQNNRIENKQVLKTTELKDFVNVIRDLDKDVSKDIDEQEFNNKGPYLSFNVRFLLNATFLLASIVLFIVSLSMSFSYLKEELIRYNVSSNIDYKVYLKPNEFYDTPYLGKGMAYVSSLIDKININYNYNFNISRNTDIDFDYKVIAKLVIGNKSNTNVFFEKEYVIEDSKVETMFNNNNYSIDKEASINYSYYNSLANKFRSKYAVDTNSYLDVYLLVNEKNSDNNNFKLNNNSKAILTIPLSTQEINISLDEVDIDENNQVMANSKIVVKSYGNVIISAIILIIVIILTIKFIKKISVMSNKNSAYDNYVNKILRGYDRIIVNIKNKPNLEGYNIIKVESFQELIDVRDNFKMPINYHVITKHQKSEFFCINDKDVYTFTLKAVDLDKDKNNEKK